MICPKCGCPDSLVTDSRQKETYNNRRRECMNCGLKFGTVELAELTEKNLIRIEVLMNEHSKPRQFEKLIYLMYTKHFQQLEYRKIRKGMKENDRSSKTE